MIYVLPQFKTVPYSGLCISTTNSVGYYQELNPFVLKIFIGKWVIFENLWQFSKVYPQYVDALNNPTPDFYQWRDRGFNDMQAHRYPMGKGAIPLYSLWHGERLGYIEARKKIYTTEYANAVSFSKSYRRLSEQWGELSEQGSNLILLDYDAYDHRKLGMTLKDVINEPKRKMGHSFVLMMMLTDILEECLAPTGKEEG